MGFWGWLKRTFGDEPPTKEDKKNGRGPARPGDDRVKRQMANYLMYLKKTDPDLYKEAMNVQMGIGNRRNDPLQQLEALYALQTKAKKMGLLKDGEGGDGIDRLIDKLPELAQVAASFAGARQQRVVEHQPPPQQLPAPRRRPKGKPPAPIQAEPADDEMDDDELEDAIGEPMPEAMPEPLVYDDTPAVMAAEGAAPMPFPIAPEDAARIAVAMLSMKRDPRDAAKWLLDQSNIAAVHGMIEVVRETPDSQLFDVLDAHAKAEPAFAPVMTFLRSRGQWSYQVAFHLRHAQPFHERGRGRGPRKLKAL